MRHLFTIRYETYLHCFFKKLAYFKHHISKFVFESGNYPLNPFMLGDYYLLDTISRDKLRKMNNELVKRVNELWVFGEISDGVKREIEIAKENKIPVKYFKIVNSKKIKRISEKEIKFEK